MSAASNNGTGYDVNNGQLRLNATTVNTDEAGNNIISSVVLYYRTRLSGTSGGAFQPITLTQTTGSNGGPKTFVLDPNQGGNSNPQPNLIATPAVTAAGTYLLDVYYQANGYNSATNATFTVTDPPTGAYTASFTVTGTPIATTIWTGGKNDNWFDDANWSNGKPTATTNALVRDLGAGIAVPYPNINSDVRVMTAGGALLYDNTGSGPAVALNLTMGGTSQAARSITRLVVGQLKVFGDFSNSYDSFVQREGTIMEFAGGNQAITGGSFVRVDISGGGTKTNGGVMTIAESLNFLTPDVYTNSANPIIVNPYTALSANAGVLATDISRPTVSLVTLADRAPTNFNNGAQLNGETDASFLFGFVRTTRQTVLVGETRTYGNIGLTITFTGANSPGNVDVTRNTVEAYSPINSKYGIRRIFGVRPSDPQTNTGGLVATMVFHYRDAETMNLGGPSTTTPGTQSITESNLVLFVSTNSGNTFGFLGRDVPVDETNNLVTKSGITTFATFTLGDKTNPLPVRLTAFDAKRVGTDALITWQTASEVNSKGYDIQVSTNGTEFRTLTSVPSAAPNLVRTTDYRYVDKEANKSGLRYYRLRQVDLDGKETFFAPVSVSFDGKAAASSLSAYPNPFTSGDELKLDVQSAASGKGQLRITDMTGRTIRQEAIDVASGVTTMTVSNFGSLKAGVYLVRVSLPSGETKNLKVVKQ
ncbi:T9SS type A sorting domain-containing protein [Hymenobacter terricola]|uniref:T9SS type A sorting domain-containing protein n=1 Tax=Hymenobacter terricola TaxID=2819236 RepID=UPI001B307FC4|nr:T9SS type A sorting domain-containing protein [Hymenobacter terricola]